MANNYTQFAERINLLNPVEEKEWVTKVVNATADIFRSEAELKEFLELEGIPTKDLEFLHSWPFFEIEFCRDGGEGGTEYLHICADDDGDLMHAQAFVTGYLKKFQPDLMFVLQWADVCDKPRAGEFGGGAMVITASDYRMMSTETLAIQLQDQLKAAKK